jgi:hypothetical protein
MVQETKNQDRKAKADRLLQESERQFNAYQLQLAVEKCQQALAIYKEIGDRKGEARSLEKICSGYAYLTGWT